MAISISNTGPLFVNFLNFFHLLKKWPKKFAFLSKAYYFLTVLKYSFLFHIVSLSFIAFTATQSNATVCNASIKKLLVFDWQHKLLSNGIDPAAVSLKLTLRNEFELPFAELSLFYRGNKIGHLASHAQTINGKRQWVSSDAFIEPKYKYKGLGLLLYLAHARALYELLDMQLTSTPQHTRPSDAAAFWTRMSQRGVTQKIISNETDFSTPTFPQRVVSRETIPVKPLLTASQKIYEDFVKQLVEENRSTVRPLSIPR